MSFDDAKVGIKETRPGRFRIIVFFPYFFRKVRILFVFLSAILRLKLLHQNLPERIAEILHRIVVHFVVGLVETIRIKHLIHILEDVLCQFQSVRP